LEEREKRKVKERVEAATSGNKKRSKEKSKEN
jgi:hypothetical protein